jgi:hypothetical protein
VDQIRHSSDCDYSIVEIDKWDPWAVPAPGRGAAGNGQIREFAFIRHLGRPPRGGEADPPPVAKFLAAIAASGPARDLFSLPFYCQCLVEWLKSHDAPPRDEFDLLNYVISRIVAREWDKIRQRRAELNSRNAPEAVFATRSDWLYRLSWNAFLRFKTSLPVRMADAALGNVPAAASDQEAGDRFVRELQRVEGERGLYRLLEDAAHAVRRAPPATRQAGSGQLNNAALAKLYQQERPLGLSRAERERGQQLLRQFALFEQTGDDTVNFTHEIIADYLAAQCALRRLREAPQKVAEAIGIPATTNSDVFDRCIVKELSAAPELLRTLSRGAEASPDNAFKSIAYQLLSRIDGLQQEAGAAARGQA